MTKYHCFLLLALFIGSLSCSPASAQEVTAQVTFFDGTNLLVEKPEFVYSWVMREDADYINAPIHTTQTSVLHFTERVKHIELAKSIPIQYILKMQFHWEKEEGGTYFSPRTIAITVRNAAEQTQEISFGEYDFNVPSEALLGKSAEKSEEEAIFRVLEIQGIGIIETQTGKFSTRLVALSGVHIN